MDFKARICYLLSLVGIRRLDCEHCKARAICWVQMLERLEELNRQTEPDPRKKLG